MKCTQYTSGKEAQRNQKTFLCKQCLVIKDYYNSNASKIGDENVKGDDHENTDKNKSGSTPGKPVTQSTSQEINTLKLNINALSRTSWLHDSHIKIAIEDIEKYGENKNGSTLYFVPFFLFCKTSLPKGCVNPIKQK